MDFWPPPTDSLVESFLWTASIYYLNVWSDAMYIELIESKVQWEKSFTEGWSLQIWSVWQHSDFAPIFGMIFTQILASVFIFVPPNKDIILATTETSKNL